MHEMSIAQHIVRIAEEEMQKYPGDFCSAIHVKIGVLRGIIPDTLNFAYEAITDSTEFGATALVIEHVPILIRCNDCRKTIPINTIDFCCPFCRSTAISILQGNELHVDHLEVNHGHRHRRTKDSGKE